MIHLFRTHYSIGSGIIQANDSNQNKGLGPLNLVDLCLKYGIKQCFVVDTSMAGFWPCYNTLSKKNISLAFGLRVAFVNDASDKSNESNNSSHNNIIFVRDEAGYKKLIKISTKAHVDFFHEIPRIDYNYYHSIADDSIELAVPFYDSFLYNNNLTLKQCIPDFRGLKPAMFIENNDLPIDKPMERAVRRFAAENWNEIVETQTVYYEKSSDAIIYQVRRCMNRQGMKQRTIEKPELAHFGSDQFFIKGV